MKELFGNTLPTLVKDPFKGECINAIHMHVTKQIIGNGYRISGSVEFKNGNTEGTQNFRANSLGELYTQIQNFCLSLEV